MQKQLKEVVKFPTAINNFHESCFRVYWVLEQVMEMVERGDSKESIKQIHEYLMNLPRNAEEQEQ